MPIILATQEVDRAQEDLSSKTDQANSFWDPILKNPSQKKAGGVAQNVALSSNPSIYQKKKKERERESVLLY
jgi:hypothetical protein